MRQEIMRTLSKKIIIALVALLLVGGAAALTFSHTNTAHAASGCPATIGYGSTGDQVKQLQNQLNYRYHTPSASDHFTAHPYAFKYPLAVDGIFGPQTKAAVEDYQAANHLAVDGIVGPHTWASLGYTPGCLNA